MARLRHIALCVKDIDASADFYEQAFGLKRSPKSEGPTAWRVFLSDGEVNLALLQYKGETGSGLKDAAGFVGIHHFGFQCDDFEAQQAKIEAAGGTFFFDLGKPEDDDFERKFRDPDGIIFDINWKGWAMTRGKLTPGVQRRSAARTWRSRAATVTTTPVRRRSRATRRTGPTADKSA